jgi:hypothetical protein
VAAHLVFRRIASLNAPKGNRNALNRGRFRVRAMLNQIVRRLDHMAIFMVGGWMQSWRPSAAGGSFTGAELRAFPRATR